MAAHDASRLESSSTSSSSDTSLPQEPPVKTALSAKSTQFSITNLLGLEGAGSKPSRGGSLSSNTSEDDVELQCGDSVSGKQVLVTTCVCYHGYLLQAGPYIAALQLAEYSRTCGELGH